MPKFGKKSLEKYNTLDPDLQKILDEVIKIYDFTILCGYRDKADQEEAFNTGRSKKHFPHGKHNRLPSIAVDIAPWPIDWENRDRFIFLAGIIYSIAKRLGIRIRYGGNWSCSWQFEHQSFEDLGHFELLK